MLSATLATITKPIFFQIITTDAPPSAPNEAQVLTLLNFTASLFLAIPILLSVALYFISFNATKISTIPLIFTGAAALIVLCEIFFHRRQRKIDSSLKGPITVQKGSASALEIILGAFCCTILAASILDLYVHGVILFEERWRYSVFTEFERRIRHISLLVWTFAPISISGLFSRRTRVFLIFWAIAFPILVLDRNRLLAGLYSALATWLLLNWDQFQQTKKYLVIAIATLSCIVTFCGLGMIRSGNNAILSTYQDSRLSQLAVMGTPQPQFSCSIPDHLPVQENIKTLPPSLQWLALYMASPIYNLEIQHRCDIRDSSLLKAQIIPLWKRYNSPGEPLLVSPRMNVGTEALPFYLALGPIGLLLCLFLAVVTLKLSAGFLKKAQDVFSLLIFLRLSYCAIFFCFAPQFFLWTTFGFVALILCVRWAHYSQLVSRLANTVRLNFPKGIS